MKLAILGGSFDPIHQGHLFLADEVLSRLHYDRIVLVPAYRSPFKLAAANMENSAYDRLEMIAASVAGDPRLTVDNCELRREGISYTVDTVKDIINRYMPDGKPGLLIGDDLADDFPKWNRSEEILEIADIIIARRIHSGKLNVPYPFIQIENDSMNISSAMIREQIASGAAWRYLVPPAARMIIEDRGLYGSRSAKGNGQPEMRFSGIPTGNFVRHVEDTARESLGFERFLHSRNTALFAWDMCIRLGKKNDPQLDPELAYLAGIAHDLGKNLSDREQIKLAKSDGKSISQMEKDKPSLLHGRAAAALLREKFKYYNSAVLEAVAMHTYGGVNMCPLAKVIYIADKMEVSRDRYDLPLRRLANTGTDLDEIFYAVLEQTVSSLRKRKMELSSQTIRLLGKMKKGI